MKPLGEWPARRLSGRPDNTRTNASTSQRRDQIGRFVRVHVFEQQLHFWKRKIVHQRVRIDLVAVEVHNKRHIGVGQPRQKSVPRADRPVHNVAQKIVVTTGVRLPDESHAFGQFRALIKQSAIVRHIDDHNGSVGCKAKQKEFFF